MKATGLVRQVDQLGRVVLPIELRRTLNIHTKDSVEIFVDGPYIMLKKYEPSCVFCSSMKNLSTYKGKLICENCMHDLSKTE